MHSQLSIHQICFGELGVADFLQQCRVLGARRATLNGPALLAPGGLNAARQHLGEDLQLQSIAHLFTANPLTQSPGDWQQPRETLNRLIDMGAELGADSIYMLTGGRGELSWIEAAASFNAAITPCRERARAAGLALAIENASALYADLHIAHSLADTLTLAEMADIDVCIELFFCWAEAELPRLFERAMPRCRLVQVSDYVYGDRSLPARAVPGDGALPLESLLKTLEGAGYRGPWELELLGPRIEEEGPVNALTRAASYLTELLNRPS